MKTHKTKLSKEALARWLGLRNGSTAQPHRNKKKYRRKVKHRKRADNE